jgi:hypothetical protein
MRDATKLLTGPGRKGEAFDPTRMLMPGAVPRTPQDWRRKRIAINVSFLWLLFPVFDLAGSHPSPLRAGCVAAGVVAYVLLYNARPRRRALDDEVQPATSYAG